MKFRHPCRQNSCHKCGILGLTFGLLRREVERWEVLKNILRLLLFTPPSAPVSKATRVKIVRICQRYSVASAADYWTWVAIWAEHKGIVRGQSTMLHYLCLELRETFNAFRHPLLCLPPAAAEKKTLPTTLSQMICLKHICFNTLVALYGLLNYILTLLRVLSLYYYSFFILSLI